MIIGSYLYVDCFFIIVFELFIKKKWYGWMSDIFNLIIGFDFYNSLECNDVEDGLSVVFLTNWVYFSGDHDQCIFGWKQNIKKMPNFDDIERLCFKKMLSKIKYVLNRKYWDCFGKI